MTTHDRNGTSPWQSAQNDTYLGNRLMYNRSHETETTLYDIVEGVQAKKILRRAAIGVAIVLVMSLVSSLGSSSSSSSSGGGAVGFGLLGSLGWLAIVLFLPYQVVLGDWNLLLHGKAGFAETAYGIVYRSLTQNHALPATIGVRRVRVGPPVRGVRNMLQVQLHKYSIYVSVFPFGTDLYLGWTLWHRDLPVVIVFRWLSTVLRRTMWNTGIAGVREVEPVKAMRDAVHDGLREGMEAAIRGQVVPLEETFGGAVPIENLPDSGTGAAQDTTRWLTVRSEVPVYSVTDGSVSGHAQPGSAYQFVSEHETGLVVRDGAGGVAVLRDTSAVTWS